MTPENIIIGNPICSLESLGIVESESTVFTAERSLPRILVDHGFAKSTSEIRRNRPDLIKVLDEPDFFRVKLGKRVVWVVVGA